jgi:hypothetical protein
MMPSLSRWRQGNRLEARDWEVRRKQLIVRIAILAFAATLVFFSIRGSFSLWSTPTGGPCPARSQWMSEPEFICNKPRATPVRLYEPYAMFRVLHLDCSLPPPQDMSQILQLCCSSTRVTFEKLQSSTLELDNGTSLKFGKGDMSSIMSQAMQALCTAPESACTAQCHA